MVIYPITILIVAMGLLYGITTLARRRSFAPLLGAGAMLSALGLALFLAPAPWRVALDGGDIGDKFLTVARVAGITGLFLLAGLRTNLRESWKLKRLLWLVAGMAVPLAAVIAFLYRLLAHPQETGAYFVLAASLVSVSFWASDGNMKQIDPAGLSLITTSQAVAMTLTGLSLAVIYFCAVFEPFARVSVSGTALTISIAYEIVKIVMLFSLAYFVATRFLAKAEKRLSEIRLTVAYLTLVALVFILTLKAANILAAVAWAFLAGAIWSQFALGRKLGVRSRPIAESLLWACALLPLFLQVHGRTLEGTSIYLFAGFIVVALVIKYSAIGLAVRLSGLRGLEAGRLTSLSLASGESAILALGFGVTRWSLDGPLYFSVLGFVVVSMIIGPVLGKWVTSLKSSPAVRAMKVLLLLACLLTALSSKRLEAASDNVGASPATEAKQNSTLNSKTNRDRFFDSLRQTVDHQAQVATLLSEIQRLADAGKTQLKAGAVRSGKQDYKKTRELILASDLEIYRETHHRRKRDRVYQPGRQGFPVWRYSDLQSVGTSGPYDLRMGTYEQGPLQYGDTKGISIPAQDQAGRHRVSIRMVTGQRIAFLAYRFSGIRHEVRDRAKFSLRSMAARATGGAQT